MRKQLLCSGWSFIGMTFLLGLAACSSSKSHPDAAVAMDGPGADVGGLDAKTSPTDTKPDAGCTPMALNGTPVLIDDMETTTHGPIQFTVGINAPLSPGYWYNSGANYVPADGGVGGDTSTPPQGFFDFTALPSPTTTLDCKKASAHAARQSCVLNGLYDTCGVGFEFAQQDDPHADAGAVASGDGAAGGAGGKGDAGPSIPKITSPFDISRYKAITFWGMTTTPDSTGSMQVKVQLPDTDTDPRGRVCNGGGPNNSKCYNSYAALLSFTTTWQQFTVLLDAGGDGGVAPTNGIAIDPTWGNQAAEWIPTEVYGINWQAQRNIGPDEGPPLMTDIWIDDVYFVE